MSYTIPPDNHVVGDTAHVTVHNNIADVLARFDQIFAPNSVLQITGQVTFAGNGAGTTGAIIVKDVTVNPNPGVSTSASLFLDSQAGQVWEVFNNAGGSYGVFDKTHTKQPLTIDPNATDQAFKITGADVDIASGSTLRAHGPAVFSASVQLERTAVTSAGSPYAASAAADCFIGCDPTSGAITVNLPNINWAAQVFVVKDETGQAGTHNITVAGSGGQTIDGAASKVISAAYGALRLYSTGTGWSLW